jgi:hypothetical protein
MKYRTCHPATKVDATIAQFRKDVKGVKSCEIGLTYKVSERSQAFSYVLGFMGEKYP